ncbi:hypothetical protein ZWY2020_045653 [Hordeum vulgare]|nr:hypothetical protein ZWY2020_045653 [Hordeum vulgare]
MDGWDQQQQTPPPPPQTQPQTPRVSSPPPVPPDIMMPQHAYGAMPPGSANVMHGMPMAFNPMASPVASSPAMKPADMPLAFNPMASPGASSPAMKPADMSLAMYRPDSAASCMPQPSPRWSSISGGELVKKKRGRPRKYGPDGTLGSAVKAEAGGQSGSAGTSFTPHIITVKPNEHVASKIMSFSQQGPRTTCIISANGALCTATLRQPATSGGIVTYEE